MTLLARKALADYLLTVHKIPEVHRRHQRLGSGGAHRVRTGPHRGRHRVAHGHLRSPLADLTAKDSTQAPQTGPDHDTVGTYVFVRDGATTRAPSWVRVADLDTPRRLRLPVARQVQQQRRPHAETPAETWALWVARRSVPQGRRNVPGTAVHGTHLSDSGS